MLICNFTVYNKNVINQDCKIVINKLCVCLFQGKFMFREHKFSKLNHLRRTYYYFK